MRVLCRHGYYSFYPANEQDLARFMQLLNIKLQRRDDYYTFPALLTADRYSIAGLPYLTGVPAIETCERRHAWEVLKANGFVYSMALGVIVPAAAIISVVTLPKTSYYYLQQSKILQAGERLQTGEQILSFDGYFDMPSCQLRMNEVRFNE